MTEAIVQLTRKSLESMAGSVKSIKTTVEGIKTAVQGTNDAGSNVSPQYDSYGHLEVAVHGPILPFGSVHTESLEPIFQVDSVYGINPAVIRTTVGHLTGGVSSATNTGTNNLFKCSTGTTALSFSTIQSKARLRYRSGQGVVGRFTMMFSEPAANSILVAGLGTGESGYYFGYNGTSFGILHSTGGVREIQTLTVTTGSSTAENITITLAGTAYSVAVTNSGDVNKTAYEIATYSGYDGWTAEQRGDEVIFLAASVGDKTGTFSLSGASTAVGTFAETLAGVAATDTWIPQASWNGDPMDGTGSSGVTLDPQKLNVCQIGCQYLGAGAVTFQIEAAYDGNNPVWIHVHTIKFPNSQTTVNVTQPSFPFTMSAYSAGSTTDVSVSCGSFAGFVEGRKKLTGPAITFNRETSGYVGSTANTYYPLFTIRNDLIHGHSITERANQSVVNLTSVAGSHDDATPITFYLIRNATLGGTPVFQKYSTVSCCYWDVAATTCTITSNEQLVKSIPTGQTSNEVLDFTEEDITVQPGETITLAARAVTGTATYVNASLNTREDQ